MNLRTFVASRQSTRERHVKKFSCPTFRGFAPSVIARRSRRGGLRRSSSPDSGGTNAAHGHRSLYQAKHTYATLELLAGESPAIVARNLGISLATLEKHYVAALQKGRLISAENTRVPARNPTKTPRRQIRVSNYPKTKASPTGFEPVLPT